MEYVLGAVYRCDIPSLSIAHPVFLTCFRGFGVGFIPDPCFRTSGVYFNLLMLCNQGYLDCYRIVTLSILFMFFIGRMIVATKACLVFYG